MNEKKKPRTRHYLIAGKIYSYKEYLKMQEEKVMTDQKKETIQFTEQKSGDTDKYKSTVGVKAPVAPTTPPTAPSTDALRAEMKAKMATVDTVTIDVGTMLSDPSQKAVRYGVVGVGQGGGRLAEQFHKWGYRTVALNTAKQDLQFLQIPEQNKFLFGSTFGGAGKSLEIGDASARESEAEIKAVLDRVFGGTDAGDIDALYLCIGGGGGSGSGAAIAMIEILSDYGLPITLLYTLPTGSEGSQTKSNAIATLDRLARLSSNKLISGLIVLDNSRIEQIYKNVSLGNFYKVSNYDVVNALNTFNTVSSLPSDYTSLDPTDYIRIMTTGGCTIFGKIDVPLYLEDGQVNLSEDDLAQVIVNNLNDSMLAEGFRLNEAVRCGVYILGKAKYLNQIPAETFNYAFACLNEELGKADIFRGIYGAEYLEDSLTMYVIVSGLGLPRERVDRLMEEAQQDLAEMEQKEQEVASRMEVFAQAPSREQDKYKQMKKQNSTFNQMVNRRRTRN